MIHTVRGVVSLDTKSGKFDEAIDPSAANFFIASGYWS